MEPTKQTTKAKGNGGGTSEPEVSGEYGQLEEYQAVGSISAQGFWNLPQEKDALKKVEGEKLCGILLCEIRTNKENKPIDAPFYIFELTHDHNRITGTGEQKGKQISLKKGAKVGVAAGWSDLQNAIRLKGHYFEITYVGEEPMGAGRVKHKLHVLKSAKAVRHIEEINPQKAAEGDKGGTGQEIPF